MLITAAAAATAVNVAFYIGPLRRLTRRLSSGNPVVDLATTQGPPTPPPASVSVVIAARDEADRLRADLPAVLAQAYPAGLEVVVANDASADATSAVLAKAAREQRRLRVATVTDKVAPGKKQALALAIETAAHDWLLATDADCRPASRHWAAAMMAARARDTDLVLGYGPYRKYAGGLNAWIRYETAYTAAQYFSAALAGRPYMGVGRNLLYHRRLYGRAGGFAAHAHLAGGDDDLLVNAAASAKTTAVCLAPDGFTYSEPKRTWRAYLRQKDRHLSVGHAYKPSDRRWLGALAGSHLGHYVGLGVLIGAGAWPWALGMYLSRQAVVSTRMASVLRGLGERDLSPWLPTLDAAVAVYYFGAGVSVAWGRLRGGRSREW